MCNLYLKIQEKDPRTSLPQDLKKRDEEKRKNSKPLKWTSMRCAPIFTLFVLLDSLSLREQHTKRWE